MRELIWFLIPLWAVLGITRIGYAVAYFIGWTEPTVASAVLNNSLLAAVSFTIVFILVHVKRHLDDKHELQNEEE